MTIERTPRCRTRARRSRPPILVNPHEHRVIDTAHRDLVRVYILGTSGFDVTTINPATVSARRGQADRPLHPPLPAQRVPESRPTSSSARTSTCPPGYTTATFTAQTFSGQQITTSKQVLNIPFSAKVPGRLHFLMDKGSAYPALRKLEATQPAAVTLGQHDAGPAGERQAEHGVTGTAAAR